MKMASSSIQQDEQPPQQQRDDDGAIQFFNCRLLLNHRLQHGELWIKKGRIASYQEVGASGCSVRRIDCRNQIIAPGYIELQINGAYGVDFSTTQNLRAGLDLVAKALPQTGCTSFCPTLITAFAEEYHKRFPEISYCPGGKKRGSTILGVHCEGPFINIAKKGAHPPECIRSFDLEDPIKSMYDMYGDISNLRIVTLAPEHQGSSKVIEELTSKGVVVSLGHSISNLDQAMDAVEHGARKITHLFNAMPGFHHRDPSLPGLLCMQLPAPRPAPTRLLEIIMADTNHRAAHAAGPALLLPGRARATDRSSPMAGAWPQLGSPMGSPVGSPLGSDCVSPSSVVTDRSDYCPPELYFGIILDGIHTHPAATRIAYRMNRHAMCLVTDAIQPMGLPRGQYQLGRTDLEVHGTPMRATVLGHPETLAGAVATQDFCVRHLKAVTGCDIAFALESASLHPAKCLGIDSIKGQLKVGWDADLVILDDDLNIRQTWINGELVFDKETQSPLDSYKVEP